MTSGINKLTVSFVSQKDSGVSGYDLTYTPAKGGKTKTIPKTADWVYYDSESEIGMIAEVVDRSIAE